MTQAPLHQTPQQPIAYKIILSIVVVLCVILATMAGLYQQITLDQQKKLNKIEIDQARLIKYIGTDKAKELLKNLDASSSGSTVK